jgi:hypothetical protein
MKKFALALLIAFSSVTFFAMELKAESKTVNYPLASTLTKERSEAHLMLVRLDEIKAMDKSSLCKFEKRQLRKEVRSIKGQLNNLGEGRFLTIGAIASFLLLTLLLL